MNSNRLPPLTKAQQERVKLHCAQWRHRGRLSIVREGQRPGHILITVTEPDRTRRYWYDENAALVSMVIERPLFTLTAEAEQTESALLLNTKDG